MNPNEPSILSQEPPHASNRAKFTNKLAIVALLIIAVGVGIFLKWEYANETVLKVNNNPFPTRVISEGSDAAIVLSIDVCKQQTTTGTLRISYVSKSREIFLPVTPERSPKGCNKQDFPILVPKDLPADTYQIKFHAVYNLNPVKNNVVEDFLSQPVVINTATTSLPVVTPAK